MQISKGFMTAGLIAALSLSLAACESKQQSGAAIGAVVGGLLGNSVGGDGGGKAFAIAVGAMAGAVVGSEIGKSLDEADRLRMRQTAQTALETGRSGEQVTWHNPDSGNYGSVTPQPAYEPEPGKYCREYQQTITVGGKTETAYGTACRQPDGTWKIIN
ncbi:RT0821/Lpp0805 family surface protein [Luteithermobacter gelatinilyticus]|uniref:RT0821/Lpp0805 family surface protein n=1 Tax=Luteithermobacter gelatinilyticus TaxID=2582913 RepID=UPI0011072E65|nr:RT0821/Lpp0805 family surface protein [Luteithermobacter gelatinilyticus]